MSLPSPYPVPEPNAAPPPKKKTKKWPWLAGGAATAIILAATVGGQKDAPPPTEPAASARSSSSVQDTSTTAPTVATSTTLPTTITPPPPPETFQGKGDSVLAIKRGGHAGIVTFECPKCTSNVIVESDGREGLLVNTIGAYTGRKLINIADGSMTTSISIRAKGAWKLAIGGLETVEMITGKPATGKGDSVVMLTDSFRSATIKNVGKSNFVVTYVDISASRTGLAVNEIGSYEGTVRLPGPSIVQVESTGTWTITPN